MARDRAADHPAIAGELPPLIPVRDFYANRSAEWGYAPSHDGGLLAWYGVKWAKTVVRIGRRGEAKPFATVSGAKIDRFFWQSYSNDLIILSEERLWQVDPQDPARSKWRDVTPRGFQNWRIEAMPKNDEDRFVIASNDRNPAAADLYTVRPDGGGKELLVRNDGTTLGWLLGPDHVPLIRLDRTEDEGKRVFIRDTGEDDWRMLVETEADTVFEILNAPNAEAPIHALSDRQRDRIALVTVDPRSGEETVVAEHGRVDVGDAFRFGREPGRPDLVLFADGYPELQALTPSGKHFARLVSDTDGPVDFEIIGASPDGQFVTVARSFRERSYEYFLFDLRRGEADRLGEYAFRRRHSEKLAETRPVEFEARDGLTIPALLTLPNGVDARSLPAIVYIHGGPATQDSWGYDHQKQFLANRGYAVLSVNFRGSTGYGKAFRAAGYGEVGRKMQDDIVDAARWLIEERIGDAGNLAVMGASYGGYAAALAMTRDPGLFKAAVIEHAPTDLVYQMRNNPFSWGLHLDEMRRYFGDPEDEADLAAMHEASPLTHAVSVEGSILLTAAKDDTVVGFEQTEEFERALRAAGKDVQAVYFPREGHGYSRWQTSVQRARLIEDFLARHLGGRSGRFDYVELGAKYLN